MVESNQEVWNSISAVINGNPTAREKELVDSWINESEGNKKFFEIVRNSVGDDLISTDEIKERIFADIEANVLPQRTRRLNNWVVAVAAVAAILIVVIFFSLFHRAKDVDYLVFQESITPYGVKSKIVLSDSTVVYLNAGTHIKYPAKFSGKTREVILDGEAYFEVYKDLKHPFIVNTSDISIRVLGTRFNVKTFPEEDLFETSLVEGSVALSVNMPNGKELVALEPNQKASYIKKTGKIAVKKINAELDAAWKDGKFYFNNEYLPSILRTLERSYNVPIRLCTQKLNHEVYTGLFTKNRTIYQTLDIMKLHKNFNYETRNDTILIYLKK